VKIRVADLHPGPLWKNFDVLTRTPRPTRHEEQIRAHLLNIGGGLGLETLGDEAGNVIIRKPATGSRQGTTPVILQGHQDMVPQANAGTTHDFAKDPIRTVVDGEWVRAEGTTLGADNGIGVAAIIGILESRDISHGPLEALFTSNEESGMDGAFGLEAGVLRGRILINTDSEEEGELCIGCSGGINATSRFPCTWEKASGDWAAYRLSVTGLRGGHSGVDIHRGRGNAISLLFRVLGLAGREYGLRIAELDAGNMRNAIPREAFATVGVPTDLARTFQSSIDALVGVFHGELEGIEPSICISAERIADAPDQWIDTETQDRCIDAICACPTGVVGMSETISGLVETSTNLSIVRIRSDCIEVCSLVRSSVDSALEALCDNIALLFGQAGARTEFGGRYPGWQPDPSSAILARVRSVYLEKFGKSAHIGAIHAGLECGILGNTYPDLDMISLGPTIRDPHSPDERVHITSVSRFWELLTGTLERIQ